MKNRCKIFEVLLIIICLSVTGCSGVLRGITIAERRSNPNMSSEQFVQVSEDFIDYSNDISDIYSRMSKLIEYNKDEIVDEMDSTGRFDWSKVVGFESVRNDAVELCAEILSYDDSNYSPEMQRMIDEFRNMAYNMSDYFTTINQEMPVEELNTLTTKMETIITKGMEIAYVYNTQATIAYMESQGQDEERIQKMRDTLSEYDLVDIDSFINEYGEKNTKCSHDGCLYAIAFSGDSDCCIVHSGKCGECYDYVGEKDMFCSDCKSVTYNASKNTDKGSSSSSSSSGSSSSGGCGYKYMDGTTCGASTGRYGTLCDAHFKELDDTYKWIVDKYTFD